MTQLTLGAIGEFGGASLLTPVETATVLRLEPHTLANWRSQGKGPVVTRIGTRRVAYRVRDVLAFVDGFGEQAPA